MWHASMQNHTRYLDNNTGLFANKYTEARVCPACNSSNYRFLFDKSGGTYVACNDCKMIYLSPVFKDDALEDYYRNNHEVQGEIVSSDNAFYAKLYTKGLNLIAKNFAAPGKILDVGCSTGSFLDIAKNNHWSCYGLELNAKEARTAQKKGHIVQENLISKGKFKEKFDAITLWDVFEHIKDGVKFLEEAKRLLNKDGIIFLQSPTRDALAAKILQAECNMFDGLEHVNLYGFESLLKICETTGFEIVNYETVISEIGVINNYLDYEDPYLGGSKNSEEIMSIINEEWIHKNNMGYKFQVCLKMKPVVRYGQYSGPQLSRQ